MRKKSERQFMLILIAVVSVIYLASVRLHSPTGAQVFTPTVDIGGPGACNSTLSVSTTYDLTADITGCGEYGLLIDTENITIDCHGFSIVSNGTPTEAGIFSDGETNITIQNCTITNFTKNIWLRGNTNDVTLTDNTVLHAVDQGGGGDGKGIWLSNGNARNILIRNNNASFNADDGIDCSTCRNDVIISNNFLDNDTIDINNGFQAAVNNYTIDNNTVIGRFINFGSDVYNSTVTNNRVGHLVFDELHNVVVENNIMSSASSIGIDISQSITNASLINNTIFNNTNGITADDDTFQNSLIENNTLYNISGDGITFSDSDASDNNQFMHNTVYNVSGEGIVLKFGASGGSIGNNNTIAHNIVYNSGGNNANDRAIDIDSTENSTIFNNTAANNTEHGMLVELSTSESNVISQNTLFNNGGEGLRVTASSGGGNNVLVTLNVITFNEEEGLDVQGFGANSNITNNTINNNGIHGLLLGTGSTTLSLNNTRVINNQLLNNGRTGLNITRSVYNVTVHNNNASNNNASGFDSTGNTLDFRNNTANNNLGTNTGGTFVSPAFSSACSPGFACLNDAACNGGTCVGATPPFIFGTCDCSSAPSQPTPTIVFTGNVANGNTGSGWHIAGFNETQILNCDAKNNGGYGLVLKNVTRGTITDFNASNNTLAGIQFNLTNNTQSNDLTIENGLELRDSSGNTLTDLTIRSSNLWLFLNPSPFNNLTNATFANNNGSIFYETTINLPNTTSVNQTSLNISNGSVRVDSTAHTFLNTSALITLLNVSTDSVVVAFDDTNFVDCNAPTCTNNNLVGTTLTFNVNRFTTYKIGAGGGGGGGGGSASTGGGGGGGGVRYYDTQLPSVQEQKAELTQWSYVTPPVKDMPQVVNRESKQPEHEVIETTLPAQIPRIIEETTTEPTVPKEPIRETTNPLHWFYYGFAFMALLGIAITYYLRHHK